jgi:hypothetical protein
MREHKPKKTTETKNKKKKAMAEGMEVEGKKSSLSTFSVVGREVRKIHWWVSSRNKF